MTPEDIHQRFLRYNQLFKRGKQVVDYTDYPSYIGLGCAAIAWLMDNNLPLALTGLTLTFTGLIGATIGIQVMRYGNKGMQKCTDDLEKINRILNAEIEKWRS